MSTLLMQKYKEQGIWNPQEMARTKQIQSPSILPLPAAPPRSHEQQNIPLQKTKTNTDRENDRWGKLSTKTK